MRWKVVICIHYFSSFLSLLVVSSQAFSLKSAWKARAKSKSSFHDSGVLYRQSVLSKQEYDAVKKDVENLSLTAEQASIAHNRVGAVAPEATHKIFHQGSVSRLVQNIMGDNYILSEDIPVEVIHKFRVENCISWMKMSMESPMHTTNLPICFLIAFNIIGSCL